MAIQIQAINFNVDKKLIQFIEEKIDKLNKFHDKIVEVEVFLKVHQTSEKENKHVELKVSIPGKDQIVKKESNTFEDAVLQSVSVMKNNLKKIREKQRS